MPKLLPFALATLLATFHCGAESSNIGVNLDPNVDWATSQVWIDVHNLFRQWGNPDQPWAANPRLKLTPDGYPLQDAGALTFLNAYPDGVYHMSYEGSATVTFSGIGRLLKSAKNGKLTTGDVQITHTPSAMLLMKVTQIDPANPMHDFHLVMPNFKADTDQIFSPLFLQRVAPFKALRFMDWQMTNSSPIINWDDRTQPGAFCQTNPAGVAYEYIIALANAAKKDVWICIPDQAGDEFVKRLARLFHDTLDPNLNLYLEFSNELWNGQFPQGMRVADLGLHNPSVSDRSKFGALAQEIGLRIKTIGDLFRREFREDAIRIRPVLAGQAVNPWWIETGLTAIAARCGDPQKFLYGIAIAPYFAFDAQQLDKPGLSQDQLLDAMSKHLDSLNPFIEAHQKLAAKYRLQLLAYEGGQHLIARSPATGHDENANLKIAVQKDPRMATLYRRYMKSWSDRGGGLFCHYSLISSHSAFGCWGLLESIDQHGSPRWDALMSMLLQPGDINADGKTDYADFEILKKNFGMHGPWWLDGDLNGDGIIDAADLAILKANLKGLTPEQQKQVDAFVGN